VAGIDPATPVRAYCGYVSRINNFPTPSKGTLRAATLRRIILAFSGTVIFIPASHAEVADDAVLWPNHGDFPAYPRDVSGDPFPRTYLPTSASMTICFGSAIQRTRRSWRRPVDAPTNLRSSAVEFAANWSLAASNCGSMPMPNITLSIVFDVETNGSTAERPIGCGPPVIDSRESSVTPMIAISEFADLQAPSNDVLTHRYGHAGIHWRVVPKLECGHSRKARNTIMRTSRERNWTTA